MIDITGAYPLDKDEWMEAFDALKKLQLFPDEYLRSKLQKFEDLYSKLLSPVVTFGDVLSIIHFQCKLLKRIQQVRKELNKPGPDDQVEKFIDRELRSQYDFGEVNFKDEILFWQSKLGFLLKLETEADREPAMISTYEKALSYIGEAEWSLEFYDEAVQYLWSLLDEPEKVFDEQKKTLKEKPGNYSKLMVNIRRITERAMGVSSFKGNSQVLQWKILNEFRYLRILEAKKHALGTNFNFLGGLIQEIDLTHYLIRTSYSDFSFAFLKDVVPMFYLFDLLLEFRDIPLAEELFEKIEGEVSTVKPTTFEIQEWFINKCTCEDDKSVRKSLDLMTYALKTIPTKEMLDFCIYKMNNLLHHVFGSSHHTYALAEIIQHCVQLYKWKKFEELESETFHIGRILFLKLIPDYIKRLETTSDWEAIMWLEYFLDANNIQGIIVNSLEKVPNSFALVNEVVRLISSKGETLTEADAGRILQYLSAVNWKDEMDSDKILQFLKILYHSFATASLESKQNIAKLFNMRMIPRMDEILRDHLKKLYYEDMNEARRFYNEVGLGTSSWILSVNFHKIITYLKACCVSARSIKVMLMNEFRYLRILEAKKLDLETSVSDLSQEVEDTKDIIRIHYDTFVNAFSEQLVERLFHLFKLVSDFHDIPLAKDFLNKIEGDIGTAKPSTFVIQKWLINKCPCEDDKSVRKVFDLINHALLTIPTSQMLNFCIFKVKTLLHHVVGSSGFTTLPEIFQLCVEMYSNKLFETFQSESLLLRRIMFLEQILNYVKMLKTTADQKVIDSLEAFLDKYPIQDIAVNSLEKFPNNFALVKEVVLSIIRKGETLTGPDAGRILQYLSAVNWKVEMDKAKILQFLKIVYHTFAFGSLEVQDILVQFFKMSIIPGIDEIMSIHVKMLYIGDMNEGRKFFNEVRVCTSSWKLAGAVIGIETDYCSAIGEYSEVLKTAIDDSIRMSELSSTIEPLKLALRSHCRMKNKKGVTELIDNAKRSLISQPNISETMYGEFLKFTDELVAELSSLGLD